MKRSLQEKKDLSFARIIRQAEKDNRKANRDQREHNYSIGDLVYQKKLTTSKLHKMWRGPYKIVSIGESGNVVTIENDNHRFAVNIKHIRPI